MKVTTNMNALKTKKCPTCGMKQASRAGGRPLLSVTEIAKALDLMMEQMKVVDTIRDLERESYNPWEGPTVEPKRSARGQTEDVKETLV